MGSSWPVEFYEDETGRPVEEFLETPALPFPYSSQVEGKLRELRAHYGNELYRVLYYGAPDRAYVLLYAFVKRTKEISRRDIEIASQRMNRSTETRNRKRRRR